MIRFFLDTEFNGWNGDMLSLALVREDGESIYLMDSEMIDTLRGRDILGDTLDPWVEANVIPIMQSVPDNIPIHDWPIRDWPTFIGEFLFRDSSAPPQVFADWPSDIADLCKLLLTGPGEAVTMPHQTHFTILRHIDVYPTSLQGAVQHNAWWDAMALRQWFMETQS